MLFPLHIGFVSTRFSGTDGVSLESAKWAQLLWDLQYVSYWYAGKLDRDPATSMTVPEAFFEHPDNMAIHEQVFGRLRRSAEVTRRIQNLADMLKRTLYDFVERFAIDILVAENALCIPIHIALGVALTNFLAETGFPAIAHHHDFHWERSRFSVNAVGDYLQMAFPPVLPMIQHVTINTFGQQELAHRKGCPSELIPNVLDFETGPPPADDYAVDLRTEIGLEPYHIMVMQPTRVVPRKGIELAINLVAQLRDSRLKLVVTHESGDEGLDYRRALVYLAESAGVDLRFIDARVGPIRSKDAQGRKTYSLADVYRHADLVTYPSLYEGFGNAFLEAVFYRKPIVIKRYSIFITDIEPKGFHIIPVDVFPTPEVLEQVRRVINDAAYRAKMVEQNYELAKTFFSYSVLRRKLRAVLANVTGSNTP
ncbi:MAG: glycosyl transferase family 1 [Planctomycetes bacterium RBG_16_64_10]|nr:MAG: glycosyl transferase family 1 [Planctomycetes bacterium RBG_16_64_10]